MPTKTPLTESLNSEGPRGIVVHALHKSASMFLYKVFGQLSEYRGIPFYSENHAPSTADQVHADMNHDFCCGPLRDFKEGPIPFDASENICRIYHLRDPRDILVSQYYSFGWRHSDKRFTPRQKSERERIRNMTVDQYALNEGEDVTGLKHRIAPFLESTPRAQDIVVHYEEMVTKFPKWLNKVVQPFAFPKFGLRSKSILVAKMALQYRGEFRPGTSKTSHKRSVAPGDYLRKLQPGTIEKLDELLAPELAALGYPTNARKQVA